MISTNRLRPGMAAAATIENPARITTPLVTAGTVLDQAAIDQIASQGIRRVRVQYPALDALRKAIASEPTQVSYDHLSSVLAPYYTRTDLRVGIADYNRLCAVGAEMVTRLVADRGNETHILTDLLNRRLYGPAVHATNVTYLALSTALRVESFLVEERRSVGALAACDITNLAVGAALHDIGKTQIPSTLKLHEPMTGPPSRSYLDHVIRGGRMISDRVSPTARSVVMHHHQRFDGSGFPDMAVVTKKRRSGPLAGKQIHIFSRIVGLCDHFDNLLHPVDRPAVSPIQAMSALLAPEWVGRFDPYILWAFVSVAPPMPLGSHVRLDSGADAIVVRHNPHQPCRPAVLVLDKSFKPIGAQDLAADGSRHITHWLDEEIEPYLYEAPPEPVDKSVLREAAEAILAHE